MESHISDYEQKLFRSVLNGEDYVMAAESTGMSFSTVNNIVNKKTKVTSTNHAVYETLLRMSLLKIGELQEYKPYISKKLKEIKRSRKLISKD